ncbi:MAG: 23S rRNA (uracil(1939)-C(5))-methyltransferase RlmD [Deltaproteobacteria bacterium]|nr:23S rRNA (uracil(1939)-C(5))-methyltransferase RlmD [Deltaproteobacteria bacterium]
MEMKLQKGQTIELNIEKMAYGGRGIARLNGFVIFVRGTVPGDRILARIYKKKKDYAEATLLEILDVSSDRIEADCPYAGYCGGCQWQHVGYEKQLTFKRDHVKEPLEHIAGLKNVVVQPLIPSENIFGYRNKMEFSFSDRRWYLPDELPFKKKGGDFALGLHVPGTYHKVIDMETCLLQERTGNDILREVGQYVKESNVPVYGLKSHEGYWRYLTIRHSKAFDHWMVNLVTSEDDASTLHPLVEQLCRKFPRIKTVVNNINGRKASIAVGEKEKVLAGDGFINDKIGPFTFRVSANSFFQTNTSAALKLYEQVLRYADPKGKEQVLDLYSGTGTIPIFLADRVRSVTGIEISESATADARRNALENDVHNCRFVCGDIREKLGTVGFNPDIMIIDPPRAGMHKDVLAETMGIRPRRIVYVSCNPATLARDLEVMAEAYELNEIQPVDMFPHTYHIESVAKLSRRKK